MARDLCCCLFVCLGFAYSFCVLAEVASDRFFVIIGRLLWLRLLLVVL